MKASILELYRAHVATVLSDLELPGSRQLAFESVRVSGGQFSPQELDDLNVIPPAAIVGIVGVTPTVHGGAVLADVDVAIVLITTDVTPPESTDLMLRRVTLLSNVATRSQDPGAPSWQQSWGYTASAIGGTANVRLRTRYTSDLRAQGAAMWICTFRQMSLELIDATELDLDNFDTFKSEFLLPGDADIAIEGSLEGLYTS